MFPGYHPRLEILAELRLVSTRMRQLDFVEETARKLTNSGGGGGGGSDGGESGGGGSSGGGSGSGGGGGATPELLAALVATSLHPQLAYVHGAPGGTLTSTPAPTPTLA